MAKHTCLCCFDMRRGALALTGIQALVSFLFMGISIFLAVSSRKVELTKDLTAQDRDLATGVTTTLAVIFGVQGAWALFGFVSVLRRWVLAIKVFAIINLLLSLASLVFSIVQRNFNVMTAISLAVSIYFTYVFYRYATVVIPEEKGSRQNDKA